MNSIVDEVVKKQLKSLKEFQSVKLTFYSYQYDQMSIFDSAWFDSINIL